jgi:hypothetical protein
LECRRCEKLKAGKIILKKKFAREQQEIYDEWKQGLFD